MTIEERAQAAGARARAVSGQDLDVEASLRVLQRTLRRRKRVRTAAGMLTLSAVIAAVILSMSAPSDHSASVDPAGAPTASPAPDRPCQSPLIFCTGSSRFRMISRTPITWTLPNDFDPALGYTLNRTGLGLEQVEAYRIDAKAGVTVTENVLAAHANRPLNTHTHALGAKGLATWLASRPFLHSSPVRHGTLDGRSAWTVEVRLKHPRPQGTARCNLSQYSCMPLLYIAAEPNDLHGIWGNMFSGYTFVDVPGGGTTAIWSWTFGGGEEVLDENQALIDTISFT